MTLVNSAASPSIQGVFIHQIEPRKTVSYSDMIKGLVKKASETLTTRSRIGDIELLGLVNEGAK